MQQRPKTKSKTTLTLDTQLLDTVRDAAWMERSSLTAYTERALREYLERHPPAKMPPAPTD